MPPSLEGLVGRELASELTQAFTRIKHCIDQLTDDEIWLRPEPQMNSIGNLLLHLNGNVRQWIIANLGGEKDIRNRPAEFAERGPIPSHNLMHQLEATVDEAKIILETQTAEVWLKGKKIQHFETTGFGAGLHSVVHFWGHVQEIIHMTRIITGAKYKFAFVPPAQ